MRTNKLVFIVLASINVASANSRQQEQSSERIHIVGDDGVSDFGGAEPIEIEEWFEKVRLPEIQFVPSVVSVAIDVTKRGNATNCRILEPKPPTRFAREEICRAIEQRAKFKPAQTKDGMPRATQARITIRIHH